MKTGKGYTVQVDVPSYTAREIKTQFGITRETLDMLENSGMLSPTKVGATGHKQYILAEVKLALAVLAQSLPTDALADIEARITPVLGETDGWKMLLRKAVMATRGMPAKQAASEILKIIAAATSTAALEQAEIIIPGIGKLTRKPQKARTYKTKFSKGAVTVDEHERWRFSMSTALRKAVRQRTTKK